MNFAARNSCSALRLLVARLARGRARAHRGGDRDRGRGRDHRRLLHRPRAAGARAGRRTSCSAPISSIARQPPDRAGARRTKRARRGLAVTRGRRAFPAWWCTASAIMLADVKAVDAGLSAARRAAHRRARCSGPTAALTRFPRRARPGWTSGSIPGSSSSVGDRVELGQQRLAPWRRSSRRSPTWRSAFSAARRASC